VSRARSAGWHGARCALSAETLEIKAVIDVSVETIHITIEKLLEPKTNRLKLQGSYGMPCDVPSPRQDFQG